MKSHDLESIYFVPFLISSMGTFLNLISQLFMFFLVLTQFPFYLHLYPAYTSNHIQAPLPLFLPQTDPSNHPCLILSSIIHSPNLSTLPASSTNYQPSFASPLSFSSPLLLHPPSIFSVSSTPVSLPTALALPCWGLASSSWMLCLSSSIPSTQSFTIALAILSFPIACTILNPYILAPPQHPMSSTTPHPLLWALAILISPIPYLVLKPSHPSPSQPFLIAMTHGNSTFLHCLSNPDTLTLPQQPPHGIHHDQPIASANPNFCPALTIPSYLLPSILATFLSWKWCQHVVGMSTTDQNVAKFLHHCNL